MKRFASERVTGLMERLGLDDDVAIESRLVSRTIESRPEPRRGLQLRHPQARRRVRRRHQQAARDDLRRARQGPPQRGPDRDGPDLPRRRGRRPRRRATSSATTPTSGTSRACRPRSRAMGLTGEGTTRRRPVGARQSRGDREHVRDLADEQLAAKAAEVGEEDWKTVERLVLIRTIDSLWVEHLTELDDMRRGIGLRGYAQQDPLNEFKREAFQLYDELRGLIRHGVASSIFRVTVTRAAGARDGPRPGRGRLARRGAAALAGGNGAGRRRPARRRDRRRAPARGSRRPRAGGSADPARRPAGASRLADARIARRRAGPAAVRSGGRPAAGPKPGFTPERCTDRAQRSVLVRFGREVQEVSRALTRRRAAGSTSREARSLVRDLLASARRVPRRRARRRLRHVPGLGAGPARRAPAGRCDRRHGRRPVRRPAVPALRGPARPRGRALSGRHRAAPRRDRRQGRRRPDDRGGQRPRLRHRPRRPGRRRSCRGPQPDDARIDPRRRRRCCATTISTNAVFVSDRPHMLRVLRMAADDGITAWGSPTSTSPIERDPAPPDRRDAPRARRAGPVLPGRQRVLTVPPGAPIPRRNRFPSWRWGFGPVYCAKTRRNRAPQGPRHHPHRVPFAPCPAQRKGAREAG